MSAKESEAEFVERLAVAKACAALVFPRGAHESPMLFAERLRRQKGSKRPIMPRSKGEVEKGFSFRCEIQALCTCVVHPYDAAREDEAGFLRRLQAHQAKTALGFEPGDVIAVSKVLGPPSKASEAAAGEAREVEERADSMRDEDVAMV